VTRIAVAGAGRMGQAIARLARSRDDLTLTAIWARDPDTVDFDPGDAVLISGDLAAVVSAADVLIDFSLPEATRQILDTATRLNKALVCGVSGLNELQMAAVEKSSGKIPLLYDRNMSQGIAVLDSVLRQVAGTLGPEFAVEIRETHHVHKKDAPSGTALKLGDAVVEARGNASADSIHYESERRGEVPGDHTVILRSPNERLEFSHSVTSRDVFAEGALRAAAWLASQKNGRYSMQDVLFGG
jgi:4-hydroxy-tetrahydrodipicolinate reductase